MKNNPNQTAVEALIDIIEKWPDSDAMTLKIILVESLKMDMIAEEDAYDIYESFFNEGE